MILLKEHVVIKVSSIFIDEARYKDMKLLINVMFRPEHHVRCYGEVVSVPDVLSFSPIAADSPGRPAYTDNPPMEFKTAEDIVRDVRVGSRAYVHYNCLLPDKETTNYNSYYLMSQREQENGETVEYHYFRVKYELIFACVNYERVSPQGDDFKWWMEKELVKTVVPIDQDPDGGPHPMETRFVRGNTTYKKVETMVGSYILVKPDKETWEDISIPTPETMDGKILYDVSGKPVMKPKSEWIVTKSLPGNKPLCGWVRAVGNPLKGDHQEIFPGMYVYFQNFADTILFYEGEELYRLRQRNVFFYAPHKFKLVEHEPTERLEPVEI